MRLVLDLETTSLCDLREVGAHVYAADPSTRVTCAGYAVDNDPVAVWRPGMPVPLAVVAACAAGATVVAHNYSFDFTIYRRLLVPLGWPVVPLQRWSCTLARSLVAGFPASLEAAGEAIGLGHKKDTSAHGLMLRFARPRSLDPLTWWHETDPERYDQLCAYCAADVAAQRELDQVLPELSPRERRLFELDFAINERGLGVDRRLVRDLSSLAREAHAGLQHNILTLTTGSVQSTGQVAKLRAWLEAHGLEIPNLRRDTVLAALAEPGLDKTVRAVLQTRIDASRSSVAKLAKITASSGVDGRVRGTLQYYGASRTGRWAGRRIQPQNLYRGSIDDVPGAIAAIQAGAPAAELEKTHKESALGIVASCLRSAIVAAPGYRLVIADFSQIEARVLAWLAGQLDALEVFRSGEDIYTHTAARIGSGNRQLGKVVVLACGFGMGATKFRDTAAGYKVDLDEETAEQVVRAWRHANPQIVNYWYDSHNALIRAMRNPGSYERCRGTVFQRRQKMLLARLPSGRHLVYRYPRLDEVPGFGSHPRVEFSYMGTIGSTWTRLRAWPGKIVENLTQAVARDVMADAMLGLASTPLIATVHDELIAEVPERLAVTTLDNMLGAMRRPPKWAQSMPVDAAGVISQRYVKA